MVFAEAPLDVRGLAREALDASRPRATEFGLSLVLEEGPLRSTSLVGDRARLSQVHSKLLTHAIHASPRRGTVELAVTERGGMLRFEVRDRGPGVPTWFRARAFDRFSQADTGNTRTVQGTGLGLPICKAIVAQHGGRVGFDDRAGGGTIFWVCLPGLFPEAAPERASL